MKTRHFALGAAYGLALGLTANLILAALDRAAHRTIRPRP